MKRIIRIYLYILPFYSLVGIILSAFRTAYQDNYAQWVLLFGASLDLIIIISGRRYLFNKTIGFLLILISLSFLTGLFNENELTRRYITDITNPLFFFGKIYIFKEYWRVIDFSKFMKYFINVSLWGSLLLLPLIYLIFNTAGATRLAIFPPMELPFSFYMQGNGFFLFLSLIVIIFYGKRAQLVGAIVVFFIFTVTFKRKAIVRYLIITSLATIGMIFLFANFSDNLAIRRLSTTFQIFADEGSNVSAVEAISAGRDAEIDVVISQMNGIDYFLGKGLGYTYIQELKDGIKDTSNVHFSPLGFLSKYGLVFTIFIYYFLISNFSKVRKSNNNTYYITAFGTAMFVFIESFFAYALFVAPIFPIVFGYIILKNSKQHYVK